MTLSALQREGPLFLLDPLDGKYKVKDKCTGKLEPAWKHLFLEAGDEFANYVRRSGYCAEFPYDPKKTQQLEHHNLWPQRKLRILFFASRDPDSSLSTQDNGVPEIWSPARVLSWREMSFKPSSSGPGNATMQWTLQVEFEATGLQLQAGVVVKLKGLKNRHDLNGHMGLVADSCPNGEGRYRVISMEFGTQKAMVMTVKTCNMERVHSMEFIVHRIEITCGGVLKVETQSKFSPMDMRVTFHWVKDLVQTGPYWSQTSPGKKWFDPFSAEDDWEGFRSKYHREMEVCLQHEKVDDKTMSLVRLKEDLKSSLHFLTRNGSPIGMREARLLLLTKPLAIALAAMKELVVEVAHNIHFLEVIAWMYYKTEDFRPHETVALSEEQAEAGTKLGLDCDSGDKVRLLQLVLFVDVTKALVGQKEYKRALAHVQSIIGHGFFDKMIDNPLCEGVPSTVFVYGMNKAYNEAVRVAFTCAAAMGRTTHLNDVFGPILLKADPSSPLKHEHEQWFGTNGQAATVGVSWTEDKYDAEAMAWTGGKRICVACRRPCLVTYWCKQCKEVPYCSAVCSEQHWKQNGHWRKCVPTDGEYVGPCAVCKKRSVVGCNYCKFTYYCGSRCQRKHWLDGGHREKCPKTPMSAPLDK